MLPPLQSYSLSQSSAWYVINEFFYLKKKSCFVLEISRFLCFCETCRFQNLWRHDRYCCIMQVTFVLIFWILSPLKMKFRQILVCCMTKFVTCYWLNAGDWKLVPASFMILLKWQYSKFWSFLMADIYHF